jgi:hypothetical protein
MALVHAITKVSIKLITIYFHSFEIFIIHIGEMAFCKPEFIIIKSNYFQNGQKRERFLDYFEALEHERRFRALVLQNNPKSIRTSARKSISRTSASK